MIETSWFFFDVFKQQNFVRSGIRTHASNGDQKPLYPWRGKFALESGALDRSAILTAIR